LLVSILVPTYKQEKFIAQCLNNILSQKVDFEIEVLVGDDCSPDGTVGVIESLAETDSRIKLYQWCPNEGGLRNIDRLLEYATGKYVTIIEGDDYWIDETHLAKSVIALEENPEILFTTANYSHLVGVKLHLKQKLRVHNQKMLRFWHLALGNFLQMGTIVYRRGYYPRVPNYFMDLPLGDYPLVLTLLNKGRGLYLSHMAMAYRVHAEGVWSSQPQNLQAEKTLITLDRVLNFLKLGFCNKLTLNCYISRLKIQFRRSKDIENFFGIILFSLLYNYRNYKLTV